MDNKFGAKQINESKKEGVAELASKKLIKSLNFHKLRLFYVHKVL